MTVPNIITLSRIALIPFFMLSMSMGWRIAALTVFSVIAITDSLDGYLARKMNQISNFGKIIDPLADKLLVLAALAYFLEEGTVAAWVAVLVLARDLLISALRTVAAASGVVIAADLSGKIKTAVQFVCVVAILSPWHQAELFQGVRLCDISAWSVAAITVWSGTDYMIRRRDILRETINN